MIKVLSIIGATASGKTALSLELAEKFNGEIISCDSVQIYKKFDIVSAKPSPKELSQIPHHLIDTLEPTQNCNAGYWKEQAVRSVKEIINKGKVPIMVGGTGLYLKSLYIGMFEQESRNQEYREYLNSEVVIKGLHYLYKQLQKKDPDYANKISSNDQLRIIRALEAIEVTGIPLSQLHQYNTKPDWQWIFTKPQIPREKIYQNIEKRVHQMINGGAIDEVRNILLQYGGSISPLKTIGYRHIIAYLQNAIDKQTMLNTLILDTRHFAKRQETLFRSLVSKEILISPQTLLEKGLSYG